MSAHDTKPIAKMTAPKLRALKGQRGIVAITAYNALSASWADELADILLVGDSMGMVLYGMPNTHGVTLDMSIQHGKAVAQAAKHALVLIDMPFGTYEQSPQQAFENCARAIAHTGAAGVKLEGGVYMAPTIEFLTQRGIPVLGHIGLTPQGVHQFGGFKQQGTNDAARAQLLADAHAVADAGAFAMVVEHVPDDVGAYITQNVAIPTIGIGAGLKCDGQIAVMEDLLGLTAKSPPFATRYAELGALARGAIAAYGDVVRKRGAPSE